MTTTCGTLPTMPYPPDSERQRVLVDVLRASPSEDRLSLFRSAHDPRCGSSEPRERHDDEGESRDFETDEHVRDRGEEETCHCAPKSTIRPTAPTATLILRLCMAASSVALRRCDGVGGGDSNAPHSTFGYLMAAPEVRALHKRFVRRAGWSAGHGRKTRFRVDARRPRRSRRPARTRREHQESDEGRRAVRTASRSEPRDDLREVVNTNSRVVRGRNDAARRARPLPQPE